MSIGKNNNHYHHTPELDQSDDRFVVVDENDDSSSSLPPDYHYFENNVVDGKMNKVTNEQQSEPITVPTTATMTASLSASTTSFSFEITLPPPAEVSPLSCRESVVTAMMARPLDRALEQREILPTKPPLSQEDEETSLEQPSPTERQRRVSHQHHHNHHHQRHRTNQKSSDRDANDVQRRRSRSTHATISRKLSTCSTLSDASKTDRHHHKTTKGRSRSERPTTRSRSESTDGRRTSSSQSKSSRDIEKDQQRQQHHQQRRHRSRSRAEGDDTSTREMTRRTLTIASIKEEVEEAIDSPKQSITEEMISPPIGRQRSSSRHQRYPSSTRESTTTSSTRGPQEYQHHPSSSSSKHRRRSPSSSHHRSKSRQRSPSQSHQQRQHGERRSSSSKNPSSSNRERSKSRSRHRSRSRSHSQSRNHVVPSENEVKEYLVAAMQQQNHPPKHTVDPSFPSSSNQPCFLSRLAESNKIMPKSVRWDNTDKNESIPIPASSALQAATRRNMVVVEPQDKDAPNEQPNELPPRSGDDSKHRNRSKSRSSRQRSKSRKRTPCDDEEEKKKKKPDSSKRMMKWDDLLNASKNSFHFSADSFCYDPKGDIDQPSSLKTIQPLLNPVVFRNGIASPTSTSRTTPTDGGPSNIVHGHCEDIGGVNQIIMDTKKRAEDSRKRQAKITGQHTSPSSSKEPIEVTSTTSSQTSIQQPDVGVRLQKANALILEKKKRREASKARQEELHLLTSPPSSTILTDKLEINFPKSPYDIVQGGAQFSPALRLSNMAISPRVGLESTKVPLTKLDIAYQTASLLPRGDDKKISRQKDRNQGIEEDSGESMRNMIIARTTLLHVVSEEDAQEEKQDQSSRTRISRKERAEARRASRGNKMGASSNKWKELSVKVEKIQTLHSIRTITENVDPPSHKTKEASPRKVDTRRSKWAGLKGGMDFISRTKKITAESKANT